jgi:LysR family hydrogen peroxide-inducible transcriptional activator
MNLQDLRYLVTLARERHFRRAAELCFITQPALSLSIRKLEDELGVTVFERLRNDITITPIGQQLIEQAQRVLDEASQLTALANASQDPLRGVLRLGVIHTVGPYLLPELIPALHRIAPHMPLAIEENTTASLEHALRNGTLDAIVIALPFGDASIETAALYDEEFVAVVPKTHAWATRRSIRPQELADEQVLLLDSGHCFSNQVAEACPSVQRSDSQAQHGTSLETIRNMVASGLGITVLPGSADTPRYRSELLQSIPFTKPAPSRRIALAWRTRYARSAAIITLIKTVRELQNPWMKTVK